MLLDDDDVVVDVVGNVAVDSVDVAEEVDVVVDSVADVHPARSEFGVFT